MARAFSRRTLVRKAAALAAAVPFLRPQDVLAQRAEDLLRHVHPDLRPIVAQYLPMIANQPPLSAATLQASRQPMVGLQKPRLPDVQVEKRQISGARGQPPVTVFIINSRSGTNRPAILHTHGGGYVLGTAESGVPDLQALCKTLDCVAVTVDYRLAPETTFAGSIEDNYAGLKWLHDNAASLGVDRGRMAVLGESAGGGHAALLAITARDRGEVPIAFQCLTYPMLDDRTGSTRAVPAHVGLIGWTAENNRFGWGSFLGRPPGGPGVPVRAVPARTDKFAGLPPAFIGVGTIDLFHDEDVDYAQRLNAAGVPAELIVVPGAPHGFDMMPAKVSAWFNTAKIEALRRGLGITNA